MAEKNPNRLTCVVNSTPLIALSIVGHLNLLKQLFDDVIVPYSVYNEVAQKGVGRIGANEITQADWLSIKHPNKTYFFPPELIGLDVGERDVILLAQEMHTDWVIIDEKLGRKVANILGLKIKGTLGILLISHRTNLITKEQAIIASQKLVESNIRLSKKLIDWFEQRLD
ncbi:MAG: nucleotide-binding protein [Anaerolineaceae bacterium 4572_78]|nr:MAG: nucleotide-binding protein [Anaerolineaceae bacterium 4572_78]